tara:strand:+ start:13 stop:900 length:888 start_codon:yes stop_codon:yes gene_type:complete
MGKAYIKGSRTMTLPILLFHPGTHGNFLARCLSVASDASEDFNFYDSKAGAHNNKSFNKIVKFLHEFQTESKDIWTYISIEADDKYVLYWHLIFTYNEFGFDLLELKTAVSFKEAVINFNNANNEQPLFNVTDFLTIWDAFNADTAAGLREMLKITFVNASGVLSKQDNILRNRNISNIFKFSWFYNWECFEKQVEKLLVSLGHSQKVNIKHHWQEFVDRKQNIIESKKLVELAFKCYTSNTSMDISNFCIYEQAYLDYLIEQHLGYEIENFVDYPKNTQDINPIEALEGIQHDF